MILRWPQVRDEAGAAVASIVAKLDVHKKGGRRGYIAMLAVAKAHRGKGLGAWLRRAALGTGAGHALASQARFWSWRRFDA